MKNNQRILNNSWFKGEVTVEIQKISETEGQLN